MASARIWWPRQIPNTGTLPRRPATVSRAPTTAAGSPGPFVRKTPSGRSASVSAAVVCDGTTVTGCRVTVVPSQTAVGPERERLGGGRLRRDDGDAAARLREQPDHGALEPPVVRDDVEARRLLLGALRVGPQVGALLAPLVAGLRRDPRREVLPLHARERLRPRDERRGAPLGGDDAHLRAGRPQVLRQPARVDPPDADDPVLLEVGVEAPLRAEAGRLLRVVADDEPGRVRTSRLLVGPRDAIVPLLRVRHADHLVDVGGIREDLLVPGHRRVEHDLAARLAGRAEREALERGAVRQRQDCPLRHRSALPSSWT